MSGAAVEEDAGATSLLESRDSWGWVSVSLRVFIISFYKKHLKRSMVALATVRNVAGPAQTLSLWGLPCFETKDIPRAEGCMCTP